MKRSAAESPTIIRSGAELQAAAREARRAGRRVGVVPTMGALHAGHVSLVARATSECDFNIVTIFVNPTQFGPQEDFARYPRDLQRDLEQLAPYSVDVVFAPETSEMYGPRHATFVEVNGVTEPWEGRIRPGHFRGVTTIVLKLFNVAQPDAAYFGQKDYQQSLVVRRMTADLNLPIEIVVCPIVREADGLALSSRNVYLSPDERQQALVLSRSLRLAEQRAAAGERDSRTVRDAMLAEFAAVPQVKLDYLAIVDADTLEETPRIELATVVLVAARVGKTRLIDNTRLG